MHPHEASTLPQRDGLARSAGRGAPPNPSRAGAAGAWRSAALPTVPRSGFRVPTLADRPPSLSAAQIDAILGEYPSPALGLGPVLYDLAVQYGIDPAYALSFFVV